MLGTGVELCSCEHRQLCMYPLQIVDTAGGLARRPLPRHARWVASSRCIGCRSELLQLVAIRTDDLPAALRPRQHLGGHVDVIARYPSTVHPQYPGALISRSLPPGVNTFIRAQCHDPLPTAKEAKKKKKSRRKARLPADPAKRFPNHQPTPSRESQRRRERSRTNRSTRGVRARKDARAPIKSLSCQSSPRTCTSYPRPVLVQLQVIVRVPHQQASSTPGQ